MATNAGPEHLIIEQDVRSVFSSELNSALEEGFTIIASNSLWDYSNSCISYYALLIRDTNLFNDDIPLTLNPH